MADEKEKVQPLLKPLSVAQYEQMSNNRRVYEKYIWQTPPIIVAIIGVVYGLALGDHFSAMPKHIVIAGMLVLGIFVGVVGYWEYRCRILLRIIEVDLIEFEKMYGHPEFVMYAKQINSKFKLPWYQRQSSTLMILLFMWGLSIFFFVTAIVYIWFV